MVNDDPKHYSERPANSVGILAYLATAYSISGDTKYKDKYYELGNNYNYFKNALNAKIDNPEDDNHSDNELIFLTYHTLFYASKRLTLLKREKIEVTGNKYLREESTSIILKDTNDQLQKDLEEMVKPLLPSIDRYWLLVKGERSPLWFGIYAGIAERPVTKTDLYGAVWSLRHWAIDLITWPINNLYRWDVNVQPFFGRDNTNQLMKEIRPPQERVTGHWNGDPFALEGGSGTSEQEPAIWELPYYLMRFYGLISD